MKWLNKTLAVLLTAVLVGTLLVPVYAADTGTADDTGGGAVSMNQVSLSIDNQNIYEGMSTAYCDGYVPEISGNTASVVIPVVSDGQIKNDTLRAAVSLGDTTTMPFVCKNYEKTVRLSKNTVNGGTVDSFLIVFPLELKGDRTNGSYPVTVQISASDTNDIPISASFTVYIVISDGKEPDNGKKDDEIIFTPKVIVSSSMSQSEDASAPLGIVYAGEKVKVSATLWNTSKSESVRNMTVSVTSPGESFKLLSPSSTQYVEFLGAGETIEISYEYTVGLACLPGQYDFALSYDYAYNKALSAAGTGSVKATVAQKLQMSFDKVQLPAEVTVSDTITVPLQAMNLSRTTVYNVRAVIEADGLIPTGTVFIGNIEGGAAMPSQAQLTITSLGSISGGYGKTSGTVTFYYEDADGNEFSEVQDISTTIKSPFTDKSADTPDNPAQWWIIVIVVAAVIIILSSVLFVTVRKRKKHHEDS